MRVSQYINNGRIWTGDPDRPWASALTVRDGRITEVDGTAETGSRLDLEGRVAMPGFVDAHLHLLQGGESLAHLDLSDVRSREQFERRIAERHAAMPAGKWLVAKGWSSENWSHGQLPDKSWLAAAGDRPVVCHRMDLHATLVNEPVLTQLDTSICPPGGQIQRNEGGEPTGLMVEQAAWRLINPLVPRPTDEDRRDALRRAEAHVLRAGITTVGTMEYARTVRDVIEPLRDELRLRCRVILLDRDWPLDVELARSFRPSDRLAVIGFKTFIDGTLGSRTARMLRDYADDPGNRGMLVELAVSGHLDEWLERVGAAGYVPCMHAIGDEAARIALDAIERVDGRIERVRIEHAQQVDAVDVQRFRGVIACMQPLHKADDCRYAIRRLGPERLAGTFPFRALDDAGAILAFGSDWPVVDCDPMPGIRAAVTGLTGDGVVVGAEHNLSVEQSLRAWTAGAAHACALDDVGVLRAGCMADLAVLDSDPFSSDWVETPPKVIMTIAGGEVVYDSR